MERKLRPRSGRLTLAQHFSTGYRTRYSTEPEKRATESRFRTSRSAVRFPDCLRSGPLPAPAMNRWSTFTRPLRGRHALKREVRRGLATLCVSGGMGFALLVERV